MRKVTAFLALPVVLACMAAALLSGIAPAHAATTRLTISPGTALVGQQVSIAVRNDFTPRAGNFRLQERHGSGWHTARELPSYRNYGFTFALGAATGARTFRVAAKAPSGAWVLSNSVTISVVAGTTNLAVSPTSVRAGGSLLVEARSSRAPDPGTFRLQERRGSAWVTIANLPAYRNYGFNHPAGATPGTRTLRTIARMAGVWMGSNEVRVSVAASGNPQLDAARAHILADTNAARARAGLPALLPLAGLHTTAQNWAAHLARTGEFRHNPSSTSTYPAGWSRAGENIAQGYDAESVVDAWLNSSGHRANILGDFTHLGVGVAWDAQGRPYYVQNFATY